MLNARVVWRVILTNSTDSPHHAGYMTDIWMLSTNAMHGKEVEERLRTSPSVYDEPEGQMHTKEFVKTYIQNKLNWRAS